LGAWASGGATRMSALADAIPRYIECVNVFGHDDDAGRRGATELAKRISARGFKVILKFLGARAST
jgi:putative DNA primase/helicase